MKKVKLLLSFILVVAILMSVNTVFAQEETATKIELDELEWARSTEEIWWEYPYDHVLFPEGVGTLIQADMKNTANTISTKVNIEKAGDYTIKLAYLKERDGACFEMAIDGVVMANTADSYNAGGWQAAATVMGMASLTAGEHTLTFRSVNEGANHRIMLDYMELTPLSNSFVTELETAQWNKSDEAVWWEFPYTHEAFPAGVGALMNAQLQNNTNTISTVINVVQDGDYTVNLAYLKETDGAQIELAIDGVALSNIADTYNAGGWQAGSTLMGAVTLTAGEHTLTFKAVSANRYHLMLDYIELTKVENNFVYEFEGNNYTKSNDSIWLENNYTHSALPVPGVVFSELNAVGEYIETESLIVVKDGKYKITLGYLADQGHDTVQISIDGVALGQPVDAYHAGGWTAKTIELGEIDLTKGSHRITITAVAGNSGKFASRLDYLSLERVGDITPDVPDTPDTPEVPDPDTGSNMMVVLVVLAAVSVFGALFVLRRKAYER